jgi:hypothetical protein
MTESEPMRYTLAEAAVILKRRECNANGHTWTVHESLSRPIGVSCDTCGVYHAIPPTDHAAAPTSERGA